MENPSKNKLTINKIAELCGVSKTTISRFLNGKYDNMSPETRERISRVITESGYHPDRTAQRLKAQKSMLIGCVIADAGSPFSAILLRGVASFCESAGYQVLFSDSNEDPAKERRAIEDFLNSRVDGLIVNTTGGNDRMLSKLKDTLPLVLVDRLAEGSGFDYVASDNHEICYSLTQRLLEMGYENIAIVSEKLKHITPRIDRHRGYCDAAKTAQLSPTLFELDDSGRDGGCGEFLKAFIAENKGRRVALICSNGVAAMSVLIASQELGIELGYDFGCVTFDDWQWLKLSRPHISAVNLGTEEKGIKAAELLIRRINGEDIPEHESKIVIPATIKYRSSTVSEALGN